VLEKLIEACDPIIDIILATRYKAHTRHFEDIKQEVRLKLWKNLGRRTKEHLGTKRYTRNPTAYLFFLIRTYAARSFRRLKNIYREATELTGMKMEDLYQNSDKG